jgi:tripartite-type tricarboxylate transporter receptor subunit TctC
MTTMHGHEHARGDRRLLALALAVLGFFMVAEVVLGIVAHSLALLADAGHMLTDASALASLIAGETDLSFPSLGPVLPHVNSGRLRALAITSNQRTPLLPNLVTIAESGYPDYAFTSWVGMLVPATTQPAIIAALNGHIVKAMRSPGVSDRLAADGTAVVASSPEQFGALIKTELARWAKVVKASGMKSE